MMVLVAVLIVAIVALGAFATTFGLSSQSFLGESNTTYDLVAAFTPGNDGFRMVTNTVAASPQPCAWSSGGTCSTALTKGDFYYQVTLTLTASAQPSQSYTLSVQENTGTGYDIGTLAQSPGVGYATLGTLTLTTPATIIPGQVMSFQVDTPVVEYNAPVGMIITVV
jgi:hypothetical protein